MDLFDRLAQEHRRIAAVCDALERFGDALVKGGAAEVHEAFRFVTFFSGYGDGYHHEREETVLFPALVRHGILPEIGPIGHLRDQHIEEQQLFSAFEMAVASRMPWGSEQRDAIAVSLARFLAFERAHMAKENEHVFPMARTELARHADDVAKAVARFEARRAPRWNVGWLATLGDDLVASHKP